MYLTNFVSECPPHMIDQETFLQQLMKFHPDSKESIQRVCCKSDKISKRYFSISEWDLRDDFEGRGQIFQSFAETVFETFYPPASEAPSDMIHVTCTGYRSPSAAQVIASRRGWHEKTTVTHAYHMGCMAALSAIRIGRGFAEAGRKEVDVVHTELCSLHLHRSLNTDEQFVALSLFADGLIKYTLTPEPAGPAFRILGQLEQMLPETEALMKWETASWGLKMTLSKEIPRKIHRAIAPFVEKLAGGRPLENLLFAIHPGGPKIIELIGRKLNLSKKQVAATEKILYTRGNMSSATLPHIWEEILNDPEYPSGSVVAGIAFGPGLTISGLLLEKVS